MAMRRLLILSVAGLTMFALPSQSLFAQERVSETLSEASDALESFRGVALKEVPPALMRDAQAVAVIPQAGKTGFLLAGHFGQGVVLFRKSDGTWGGPIFISLVGGKVGRHDEATDIILIFRTRAGVDRLIEGRHGITFGRNVTVGAGPITAQAGADPKLTLDVYSYSRSRGAFASAPLTSATLRRNDAETNLKKDSQPTVQKLKADLTAMCGQPANGAPQPGNHAQ
jgi:lipid-binding SYLF domain-containing protein